MTAPTSDDSADDGRHHRSPLSLYKRPSALKIAAQTPTLCVMSLRSSKSPLMQNSPAGSHYRPPALMATQMQCMMYRRWISAPTLIKFDDTQIGSTSQLFYSDAMRSLCSEQYSEFSHKVYVQISLMVAAPKRDGSHYGQRFTAHGPGS